MKRARFVCLFLFVAAPLLFCQSNNDSPVSQHTGIVSPSSTLQPDSQTQAKIAENYGKLPLSFEANQGQTDPNVKFFSRGSGYSLFLTGDEAVLTLSRKSARGKHRDADPPRTLGKMSVVRDSPRPDAAAAKAGGVLRMKLRNANLAAKVTGADELPGTSNYFIGNDPAKWRTDVVSYAKVKYEGIYPGIDLVYYGNQQQLEYDFIVSPGADPNKIGFDIRGARRIHRDQNGDLNFLVGENKIRWRKPLVYQEKDGARQEIAARYAIADTNRVTFELAKYDASRPLYIDPLIYSTYLGGSGGFGDSGRAIAVDSFGDAYVTGFTGSTNFPTTPGALQTDCNTSEYCENTFVAKFNAAGSALVYSTYLSPGNNQGGAAGIAVDSAGDAYIVGSSSADFPITPGAFQKTCVSSGGGCVFVTEINPSGSALIYSTYLGGGGEFGDIGGAIAVDSAGSAYVTGQTNSSSFPVTLGAFQTSASGGAGNAFVTKFNSSGSALVYSSYLGAGGEFGDIGDAIAVDSAGNAYVTGATCATDFPVTPGAFQTTYPGGSCGNDPGALWGYAFVTKINPTGSALVYSTYLGGSGISHGLGIAADNAGQAYVTGYALTTGFPTTSGAFQTLCRGKECAIYGDAFVTKFNPTGSALVYSTYLGGFRQDQGNAIAVDSAGSVYVTGMTTSSNFPVDNPIQQKLVGGGNAFVSKLNPAGSALAYSTYLGGVNSLDAVLPGDIGNGIAVDSEGNAYVTGYTLASDFPTTPGAFQPTCGNPCARVFVAKMFIAAVTTTALSSSLNPCTYGQAVTLTAVVTSALGAPPDGEAVAFMRGTILVGTGTLSGGSVSLTTSALPASTAYIRAVYAGDSNFASSTSKAVSQKVSKATTTTTLVSSLNPSTSGQSVTFTASLAGQFGGTVKGSVTFMDGSTTLKTVDFSGGLAKYTTSKLSEGTHTITATYNGSTDFTASSASLTQTLN
jgi:hypothetical protein